MWDYTGKTKDHRRILHSLFPDGLHSDPLPKMKELSLSSPDLDRKELRVDAQGKPRLPLVLKNS